MLLGVGWNFAFIGATTMVTACHRPTERNKVQALQRFPGVRQHGGRLVLVRQAAGQLRLDAVNEVVFPVVLVAAALLALARCARGSAACRRRRSD